MKKVLVGVVVAVMSASVFAANDKATQARIDALEKKVERLNQTGGELHVYQNIDIINALSVIVVDIGMQKYPVNDANRVAYITALNTLIKCQKNIDYAKNPYPIHEYMKGCANDYFEQLKNIQALKSMGL